MRYHYVMTLVEFTPAGQRTAMLVDVIEMAQEDTRDGIFIRVFNEVCDRNDMATDSVVLFWSLEPDQLD